MALSASIFPDPGDMRFYNGETTYYNGYEWISLNPITTSYTSSGSISVASTYEGDNMAVNNLHGDLLFTRDWTYLPWTVVNVKSGEEVAEVFEVKRGNHMGLNSGESFYAIVKDGKPQFPYFTWSKLLEKLSS